MDNMVTLKIIRKPKDDIQQITEGIENLEIDNKELYVFIHVSNLFKDPNNLMKSGFLLVSLLMCTVYDNPYEDERRFDKYSVLEMNSEDVVDYYHENCEDDNIIFECDKNNSKFNMKFVYLKHTKPLNSHFEWIVLPYVLDKKRYVDSVYYNNIVDKKVDLYYRFGLKHRISYGTIFKNVLSNVKKGLFLEEK